MIYDPMKELNNRPLWEVYEGLYKQPFRNRVSTFMNEEELDTLNRDGAWTLTHSDLLLRMVIQFADPESPVARMTDTGQRKAMVINKFMTADTSLKHSNLAILQVSREGDLFRRFVTWYFKLLNDTRYETWLSLSMYIANLLDKVRNPDIFTEPTLLNSINRAMAGLGQTQKDLQNLELELFKDVYLEKLIKQNYTDPNAGYAERYAIVVNKNKETTEKEFIFSSIND